MGVPDVAVQRRIPRCFVRVGGLCLGKTWSSAAEVFPTLAAAVLPAPAREHLSVDGIDLTCALRGRGECPARRVLDLEHQGFFQYPGWNALTDGAEKSRVRDSRSRSRES